MLHKLSISSRSFGSFYRRTHKKTVKKWKKYPCIPEWLQYKENDKFIYKLRSKEEVMRTEAILDVNIEMQQTVSKYPGFDQRGAKHNVNAPDRIYKLEVDVRKFEFSDMQLDRFAYLVGSRLKGNKFKLVVKQYQTFEENYKRAFELINELYFEARRAPMINYKEEFDPYLRMKNKRLLGRTKQERDEKINEVKEVLERRTREYDTNGITSEQIEAKKFFDGNETFQDFEIMIENGTAEEMSVQDLIDEIEEKKKGGVKRQLGEKLRGVEIKELQKDRIKEQMKERSPWMNHSNFFQETN